MPRKLTLGLATATALALGATPALAVDETKPTPCAGVLFTDPVGDNTAPLAIGAGDNLDITGVFFTKKAGVTSVNVVIKNLTKDVPPTALGGVDWLVYFTVGDKVAYVRATTGGSDVAFEHGIDDPSQGLTPGGTIPGAFFEGPDGIVQMDLPDVYSDIELKGVFANSAVNQVAIIAYADTAPDGGEGPSITPASCDPAPAAPATGGKPAASASTLPIALPASAGSAKKAAKAKKLALKVDAKQPISRLSIVLKDAKSKKTLASGKVASASGVTTVSLKVKGKLKKGVYVLQATGVVDGKTLKIAKKIRFGT